MYHVRQYPVMMSYKLLVMITCWGGGGVSLIKVINIVCVYILEYDHPLPSPTNSMWHGTSDCKDNMNW